MTIEIGDVLSVVKESVPAGTPEVEDYDRKLSEYGIDSLDTANILLALEDKYGVKVTDEDIDSMGTINQIVAYLRKRVGE